MNPASMDGADYRPCNLPHDHETKELWSMPEQGDAARKNLLNLPTLSDQQHT